MASEPPRELRTPLKSGVPSYGKKEEEGERRPSSYLHVSHLVPLSLNLTCSLLQPLLGGLGSYPDSENSVVCGKPEGEV